MVGYLPQYELAARAIMRHLRDQTLVSVRLGDPTAGRVDDYVIVSTQGIHGHSVKWSQYPGFVSFRNFTQSRGNAPCWIAQLAEGWKSLLAANPNRRVGVHFLTCDIPSTNDKCPGIDQEPFAAFYYEAWIPFQFDGQAIPEKWKLAWEEWQRASGLSDEEFTEFAKACQLDFHVRTAADRTFTSRDEALLSAQLKALATELPNIVRDPSRQVEFTRDALLKRLGWTHLLEFRHQHEFPTPDPYEPIESTVQELASKLQTLSGGYLALLGSPGSGKSTLLTRTLESGLSQHRLVKYYAFVPGSADPRTRGESVNFLHDLVLELERAGFSAGQSQGIFDRELLLGQLNQQLQMLGDDFAKSGFPTVILVDGLDHIPREQSPQHSLVSDLPLPDQVPEGVYFVLGSQTDDLPGLPPAVRQSIQEEGRRIQIGPISREAILKIIAATTFPVSPSPEQQEQIVNLAGGHPLALSLLLNRLKSLNSGVQISEVLDDAIAFEGDVDKYYFAYWQQIETVSSLAELFGLLARLRRPIDIDWVASWESSPPLGELRRRFGHLFREVRPDHLEFFHNSFRQYVLTKSSMLKGGSLASAGRDYHRQLAAICETSALPCSWEVVYHLAMADEVTQVVALASPEYFRNQMLALRPLQSIARDARYAAAAAGQLMDAAALVKIGLFLSELSQREFSLSAWTVGGSLLSLGHLDEAMEYLWEGNELQIDQAEALRIARQLFITDEVPLARRVFEAAEPLSLIQPAGEGEDPFDRETSELLQAWAESAPLFRPTNEVIRLIQGFVPPRSISGEEHDPSEWRALLLYRSTLTLEHLGRSEEAAELTQCLRKLEGDDPNLSVWLTIHRFRRHESLGKVADAKAILEDLLKSPSFELFSDHAKLRIAQGAQAHLTQPSIVAAVLKDIEQPRISIEGVSEPDFSVAVHFFRFYRLLMITGGNVSPVTAVANPGKDDGWPRVLLERALVQLARVSADAARGMIYTGADVRRELHVPLRLFNRTRKERIQWHGWYRVEQLREKLDQLMVEVVKEHGPEAIDALRAELERLWKDKATRNAWSSDAKRNIVLELYDAGVSEEWVRQQLNDIAETMLGGKDISGKIDECKRQSEAWEALGQQDAAVKELQRLVSVSFGVGYRKDYQMDEWVEWVARVLPLDPAKIGERVALFAASIASTEETTEGRGTRFAALALIRACVPVSPQRAVALIHWFEKYGCIDHADAVAAYLETACERRLCSPSVIKAIYVHFLLCFSAGTHTSLARALLKHISEGTSREATIAACRSIVEAVNIRAPSTSRPFILEALAETASGLELLLRDCGLDSIPAKPKERDGVYEPTLKLKDGSSLNQEQAAARATSVDGFIQLIEQCQESYYRWSNFLDTLLPTLSRADAVKLTHALPKEFEESLALSALSRRLDELGEKNMAWQIAERALGSSSTYGWAKYIDGGTRFEAIAALVAANATAGRERALKEVAANLSSESGNPSDIARRLLDIIPLLGPGLKPEQFYAMIEDYVKLLSAPLDLLDDANANLLADPNDDNCERALCELLAYHMADAVSLLARGALKGLAEILADGSLPAQRCVKEMLDGTELQQVAAVGLLEVVATNSLGTIAPYAELLQGLVLARNWWISKTAESLCEALKLENTPVRNSVPLPPLYQLTLPPSDDKIPPVGADEPLPDSENPRAMVRPYDFELGIIAEMAGLDEENLFIAAVREMKTIANGEDLTAQSEATYRIHLERVGLKFPFRRRRGAIAREAMRRVAGDLVDAQRVHPGNIDMLLQLLTAQDPQLALVNPVQRPTTIKPLGGFNEYRSNAREWVLSDSPSFDNHLRKLADKIVLGEATRLKALDWSTAAETRISVLADRELTALDPEHPFERVFDVLQKLYVTASPLKPDPANLIVVRNQWLGSDTDGTNWIALNPTVANRLGWSLAPDGLFRWLNASGEIMVETVWWKDGSIERGPYERDTEVGDGFLVLASATAADEILALLQNPTRFFLVQRSCIADKKHMQGAATQSCEIFTISGQAKN